MKWLRGIAVLVAVSIGVAGCGGCGDVAGPGEVCDAELDEACEDDGLQLVCKADEDGDNRCLHPTGGVCDEEAELNLCPPETTCQSVEEDGSRCLIDESARCDPADDLCGQGLRCEAVDTADEEEYRCYEPVVLQGVVFDAETEEAIENAHVIAFDEERSALSDVAITDEFGEYDMELPTVRSPEGEPVEQLVTLRASAHNYQTFPGGIREAQPIDAGAGDYVDDRWIIDTAQTDVALIELPEPQRGHAAIHGSVDIEGGLGGVLVVAEPEGVDFEDHEEPAAYSGVSGLDGSFTIFNVEPGDYDVRGYLADYQIESEAIAIDDQDVEEVVLSRASQEPVDVTGNIQIVTTSGETSVLLMVASTFDAFTVRGEVPAGLRAPKTGAPDIDGAWTIEGVPAGQYVVMAGFENDDLVRDPDEGIAGTDIVYIEVPEEGEEFNVEQSFKVTEAVETLGPGVESPEGLGERPMLEWGGISNADWYDITVFNAFGDIVFEEEEFPHSGGGGAEFELEYDGDFQPGMYYQFRVISYREAGNDVTPNSSTEFLRGVFYRE